MAYATEMLIQFAKEGYNMVEIPTTYKASKIWQNRSLNHLSLEFEIFSTIFKGILGCEYD